MAVAVRWIFLDRSILLTIFLGAALGNVIRGVPFAEDFVFFLPLWTNFLPGQSPGILDWYTIGAGLLSLSALTLHGSMYMRMKTDGPVNRRSRRAAVWLLPVVALLTVGGISATGYVRPQILFRYRETPMLFLIPVLVAASLVAIWRSLRSVSPQRERNGFLASCVYLALMLGGAAAGLYPTLLPSTTPNGEAITIVNAATGAYAMRVGLIWWSLGMALAVAYFVFLYRMFAGKVSPTDH